MTDNTAWIHLFIFRNGDPYTKVDEGYARCRARAGDKTIYNLVPPMSAHIKIPPCHPDVPAPPAPYRTPQTRVELQPSCFH
jgi:hypothetical protein